MTFHIHASRCSSRSVLFSFSFASLYCDAPSLMFLLTLNDVYANFRETHFIFFKFRQALSLPTRSSASYSITAGYFLCQIFPSFSLLSFSFSLLVLSPRTTRSCTTGMSLCIAVLSRVKCVDSRSPPQVVLKCAKKSCVCLCTERYIHLFFCIFLYFFFTVTSKLSSDSVMGLRWTFCKHPLPLKDGSCLSKNLSSHMVVVE